MRFAQVQIHIEILCRTATSWGGLCSARAADKAKLSDLLANTVTDNSTVWRDLAGSAMRSGLDPARRNADVVSIPRHLSGSLCCPANSANWLMQLKIGG